jgi:hypothetical protein
MVILMFAPPAGVRDAPLYQTQHKSGLLRAFRRGGHALSLFSRIPDDRWGIDMFHLGPCRLLLPRFEVMHQLFEALGKFVIG